MGRDRVATDRDNTYVTGFTLSEDFPRVGAGTRGHAAIVDAFVTKIAADGSRIEWSTQLGGVDMDMANAVTVDTTATSTSSAAPARPTSPPATACRTG